MGGTGIVATRLGSTHRTEQKVRTCRVDDDGNVGGDEQQRRRLQTVGRGTAAVACGFTLSDTTQRVQVARPQRTAAVRSTRDIGCGYE